MNSRAPWWRRAMFLLRQPGRSSEVLGPNWLCVPAIGPGAFSEGGAFGGEPAGAAHPSYVNNTSVELVSAINSRHRTSVPRPVRSQRAGGSRPTRRPPVARGPERSPDPAGADRSAGGVRHVPRVSGLSSRHGPRFPPGWPQPLSDARSEADPRPLGSGSDPCGVVRRLVGRSRQLRQHSRTELVASRVVVWTLRPGPHFLACRRVTPSGSFASRLSSRSPSGVSSRNVESFRSPSYGPE